MRFELAPADGAFRISSRARLSEDPWALNAVGRLVGKPQTGPIEAPSCVIPEGTPPMPPEDHYRLAEELGLAFGPAFQGFAGAWPIAEGEILARITPPAVIADAVSDYLLHPCILDACFQTLLDVILSQGDPSARLAMVPVRVGRLRLHVPGGAVEYCQTRLLKVSHRSLLAEYRLLDGAGRVIAELEACRFQGMPLRWSAPKAAEWIQALRLKPLDGANYRAAIPDLDTLVEQSLARMNTVNALIHRPSQFQSAIPLLDAMVAAFAYEALRAHVIQSQGDADEAFLPASLGMAVPGGMLDWMVETLEEDGLIEVEDGHYRFVAEPAATANDIWLAILGDDVRYMPDLLFAGRAGRYLADPMATPENQVALVKSIRASAQMEQYFAESPIHADMNRSIASLLRDLAADWPTTKRLRVLKIGAGGRSISRQLLSSLDADRCDYVIALPDADSLDRARAEFAEYGHVTCAPMDAEGWTVAEEFHGPRGFDVILVVHDLHERAASAATLEGAKRMLARGGMLVCLERYPDRVANLIFGLDDDWWSARGSRLRAPSEWMAQMRERGFDTVRVVQDPMSAELDAGSYAILATNPDPYVANAGASTAASDWLILVDDATQPLAQALGERLRDHGQRCGIVAASPWLGTEHALPWAEQVTHVATNLLAAAQVDRTLNIVQMHGLSHHPDASDLDPAELQDARCVATLTLVRALAETGLEAHARLWLVGSGASVVAQAPRFAGPFRHTPSQAPIWGLGRVIANEHPSLHCRLIDLGFDDLNAAAGPLAREFIEPDGEDEIVLSAQGRYVTRMRARGEYRHAESEQASLNSVLDFDFPGQLKNLRWHAQPLPGLMRDEIEIRPMAVGLNFRDVMYAMGLLSDEAVENGFAGATMGLEVAGTITRVGADVDEFAVGDHVVAFAPACFASRVVTKARSAVLKPDAWTFEEAATVPTVFFTAYYALHYLARLRPGEKVLIHGAAGGVGLAALQVARYLGAEVFATAGSEEKRGFVTMLGADHVLNSRNLAYADEIMRLTEGRGIDVVLNSLAGEAINRNFRILRPFGRFLELGKRDFYENTKIGLRPFKDNITYFGIDADQLMVERPELTVELFREVMDLFEQGVFKPLPYRAFAADKVVDAFRYMQQSRQIGKIVVSFGEAGAPAPLAESKAEVLRLEGNATYLVTGGLGGFGLKTARWLVRHGALHLALLGRRGADSPEAGAALDEFAQMGVEARAFACDVTDRASLATVIAEIGARMPPLKGVVHAATVLDDGVLRNIDDTRFRNVLRPKILGAWHLHELTRALPLDFFVMYSSATTSIGNPGQANYVAANMYLESLAALRHDLGLPATCPAWGAIEDVGILARNEAVKDALEARLGGKGLASDQALEHLARMMLDGESNLAVMNFDWQKLKRVLPSSDSPRFDELRRQGDTSTGDSQGDVDLAALLDRHGPEELAAVLARMLTDEVAQILRLPAERIAADRSLYDLGMDSLMGVELVLGIEKRFGVNIPVMALSEGPTITRIAERLAHQLAGVRAGGAPDHAASDVERMTRMISGVAEQHAMQASSEEIEQTLDELMQLRSSTR
jgi:NADPH:quinone reductase-like Zn-dependent oxidoreductase/acyl carrier protein/SAM-dependent methyltransferase